MAENCVLYSRFEVGEGREWQKTASYILHLLFRPFYHIGGQTLSFLQGLSYPAPVVTDSDLGGD